MAGTTTVALTKAWVEQQHALSFALQVAVGGSVEMQSCQMHAVAPHRLCFKSGRWRQGDLRESRSRSTHRTVLSIPSRAATPSEYSLPCMLRVVLQVQQN